MARNIRTNLFSQTVEAPFTFGTRPSLSDQEESEGLIQSEATKSSGSSQKAIDDGHHAIRALIYMVGFSEGLTHLAVLAIYYLLKDDLQLGPAGTSALFIIPSLPWFLKPGLAFLSDTTPIFGMRRKPYLMVFSFIEALGYLLLAEWPSSIGAVSLALLIIALGAAFCSAISEALVVETTNLPMTSSLGAAEAAATSISELIGAKAVGSLVVAYLSGALLELYSKQTIFRVTAVFPLLITAASCFMTDPSSSGLTMTINEQILILKRFLKQKAIWGPALFILLFMGGPDYDDAMFYFFTNEIGFSPSFMGSLRFTYGVAALMGIVIYNSLFRKASYRKVLLWTILAALPIYISPTLLVSGMNRGLGISDEVFVLSGGFLIEAVAEIQLLPLLVFTALICPAGLEASVYSIMMSIRNLGSALGKLSSAAAIKGFGVTATDFSALSALILTCGAITLLPLLVIKLIPTPAEMANLRKLNSKNTVWDGVTIKTESSASDSLAGDSK